MKFAKTVGANYAIATVNGTAALHISLLLADVGENDEVITQPLTFIATGNAISYCRAKHLTTTAKILHKWEYVHDEIGYNYRLPNLNAALLCAQLEQLQIFLGKKRALASKYKEFFASQNIRFIGEPQNARSNYWLIKDRCERDEFLTFSNENGVMTRPIWMLMNTLDMFKTCQCGDLSNSLYLEEKIVNIPSSVRL